MLPSELLAAAESAEGLSNPSIALNPTGLSDWSTQTPFIDLAKTSRPWLGHMSDKWGAFSNADLDAGGYLDADGWPTALPPGATSVSNIWDWSNGGAAAEGRKGVYVVNYEGQGELVVSNVRVLSREPGRIVFENTDGGTFALGIRATDPEGVGDYIRDISVVRAEYEELHEAGAIFNPDWLARVSDFRQFRFMAWMETNNSDLSDWSDRPKPGDATWSKQGAPVEVMVQLANEAGVDPWFTMPHLASDDYIRAFATYVRDNLDPDLVATVEFSNEVWNWAFQQPHELLAESQAAWGDLPDAGDNAQMVDYHAKRATESALIWDEVFGDAADARLIKTLGSQTGNAWVTKRLLAPKLWQEAEPDTYTPPAEVFDAVAVTTYFGSNVITREELREGLLAAIADPEVDAFDYLFEKLQDPAYESSIPRTAEQLRAHKAVVEDYGLKLISYEGGQHVHHLFATDGKGEALGDFLAAFVRSPQMAELYKLSIEAWREIGDGPYMQFGDVGQPSKWGSWSFLSDLGDSNPRSEVIYEENARPADFEDRAGAHFQQGVTRLGDAGAETLTGTIQEDYLIGAGGDDVLVGGKGNDGLHGGDGVDVAVMSGRASDYVATVKGAGVRLTGPDGSDFLVEVEFVQFESGGPVAMADLLSGNIPDPGGDPDPDPDPGPDDAELEIIRGGAGDNILRGSNDDEAIYGFAGRDLIRGHSGDDLIKGGSDNDRVLGNMGDDTVFGGDGDDRVSGNRGVDAVFGGDGDDRVSGGGGRDTVFGGAGNDRVLGNKGADQLFGDAGDDTLLGHSGDDTLTGGAGRDLLNGGRGADMFVFQAGTAYDGIDVLQDFNARKGDAIDVSSLFGPFAGAAIPDNLDDYIRFTQSGGQTHLYVNADGQGDDFREIAEIAGAPHFDAAQMIEDEALFIF